MPKPKEIIESWTIRLMAKPAVAQEINASFKFVVTGKDGGTWVVDCRDPVQLDEGERAADCTLELSSEDFLAIADGKLNPQLAFMSGKLRLAGDLSQALKLSRIFSV